MPLMTSKIFQSVKAAWSGRVLFSFHRGLPLSACPPHLHITKEDIRRLPEAKFKGETLLISDPSEEKQYLEQIMCLFEAGVVGVDTEAKPSRLEPALVQVASDDVCICWRLRGEHLHKRWFLKRSFPKKLKKLLTSDKVLKVGHALGHDARLLMKHYYINMQNYFDTVTAVQKQLSCLPMYNLKGLTAIFHGLHLNKRLQMSNWEKSVLEDRQIDYASTDAWASLIVYKSLIKYASRQGILLGPPVKSFQNSHQGQKMLGRVVQNRVDKPNDNQI